MAHLLLWTLDLAFLLSSPSSGCSVGDGCCGGVGSGAVVLLVVLVLVCCGVMGSVWLSYNGNDNDDLTEAYLSTIYNKLL